MKCRTCARRLDLEKLDYTVGCKHEQMEGFICLACAFEGVAYWMTNVSEDDYCEEYIERIHNAFPTHECVKPTHSCVEKQVTGKLINVEIPTKRESEEAEKQVNDELISRQAAIDAINTHFGFNIDEEYGSAVQEVINGLPSEPVGISDNIEEMLQRFAQIMRNLEDMKILLSQRTGHWIHDTQYGVNLPEHKCSECGTWEYSDEESNFCPECGAWMREERKDDD